MSSRPGDQNVPGRLAITGASGQLGRRTAELVLESCEPERLVLVTRNPDSLADLAARGVSVRFGDFADPASLKHAFDGVQRMLLISATDLERRTGQHRDAIRAAVDAGVRHIVYTSGLAPEPGNPAAVAPSHYATERALADSGIGWTVLRNSLYAEYQAADAERAIRSGRLVHNRGDGTVAYVSREDCARAAAAVLVGGGHDRAVYDITGPERYGAADLARLYGQLGSRNVEQLSLADDEFIASLVGDAGDDDHLRYGAELVASFGRSIREGYMSSCTDAVEKLTGRPPRRLLDVLQQTGASAGS
ncbi:MAG: SDR family oxidoreductase [Gammaproteobacteria bacterium]|nr:SDR family oxidoreductase [Gammaproteobacteria bacterium]